MGAIETVGDPVGSFLILGAAICLLGAVYLVCYTFFMANWEGWESWHARTGLDEERALQEIRDRRPK
jgi:hypothetical protein